MSRQTLMTLVQVSDLHIGAIDPNGSGNAAASPAVGKMLAGLPYLDGLIGHGGGALRDLAAFLRGLPRQRGVPRRLMVTGDFTRCGHQDELALSGDFFHNQINIGTVAAPLRTGVNAQTYPVAIPGNHDHWGGVNWPVSGAVTQYGGASFARRMPRHDSVALANGQTLVLAQIDSDADVYPMGAARGLARGDFRSQLQSLGQALGPPQADQIRVLAVHHSYAHRGHTLRMQNGSRSALLQFIVDHGIKLLLTGHTHVCDLFEIRDAAHRVVAHELCCGSTTQLDHVPPAWQSWLTTLPKLVRSPNSLLLHSLAQDAQGRLHWRAAPHYRHRALGFRNIQQPFDIVL